MLNPVFLVAFTGHRPKATLGRSMDDLEGARPAITEAFNTFKETAEASGAVIEVLCSVAEGADQIACEVAIDLGLPLHLIIPLPVEPFAQDFDECPEAWVRAEKIIAYCSDGENGSTFRVARGSHTRDTCYAETNIQILDTADALIALWDGVDLAEPGGTSRMLEQAKALKLPILCIDSTTARVEPSNFNDFASAESSDTRSGLSNLHAIVSKLDIDSRTGIGQVFEQLDKVALSSSRWYRRATTLSIAFHGIAALIAGISVSFYASIISTFGSQNGYLVLSIIALAELLLVGGALLLMWRAGRKNTQHIWMRCRFAAELLRGMLVAGRNFDPVYPQIMRHLPEWRRFALTCSLAAYRSASKDLSFIQQKNSYLADRVNDQITYYEGQHAKAFPRAKWCKGVAGVFSILAIGVISVALFSKATHTWELVHSGSETSHSSSPWLALLPIALPLIAGMATALLTALDLGRRAHRYHQMKTILIQTRNWIEQLDTEPTLCRAIARTEEILLDEQIEWMTAANSGSGH